MIMHPQDVNAITLGFTFLTNHAHVLISISRETDVRMRDIAIKVGITERAVQRIVDDLTITGYLKVTKEGRRNRYELQPRMPLRHPVERDLTVADLIRFSQQ
jgi:DNA-binding MarR family transcriptional regulator